MTNDHEDQAVTHIIDPPSPDLDDVFQREPLAIPAVRVKVEGPVRVQNLPNRVGGTTADSYSTTAPERILNRDPRRAVATLVGKVDWFYMTKKTGVQAPIPANAVLTITHADEVWVKAQTVAGVVVAIQEFFAD